MKVLAILLLTLAAGCYALPGGPPNTTCFNLMPQHGMDPRPNPSPYEIDLSDFFNSYGPMPGLAYLPGAYYTITLRARNDSESANATFRGFIIQARNMNGNATGTFQDPAGVQPNARLSQCTPPEISVTHSQPGDPALRVDLTSVTFTWRAPTTVYTGPIRFWYTTVERFPTYWVGETTAFISEIPLTCPNLPSVGVTGGASSVTSAGVWALLTTAVVTALKIAF